ncbi:hypothetical protein C4568_00085 [Candidatus Parcubacteria bacterium]|nr:MAG: hypothetical protein C4568_00085 [Candidatus Parcubacteria bacterium]
MSVSFKRYIKPDERNLLERLASVVLNDMAGEATEYRRSIVRGIAEHCDRDRLLDEFRRYLTNVVIEVVSEDVGIGEKKEIEYGEVAE